MAARESTKTASSDAPPDDGLAPTLRLPALGKSISADLEALRNDVEQAREMACEYQRQLAGKANDHANLKCLFDKTREDLIHLHNGLNQLREERHHLANEAMRAAALELKLARVTAERDRLQNEVQALRHSRAGEGDDRVAQLSRELERLRRAPGARVPATEEPSAKLEGSRNREYISMAFAGAELDDQVTVVPTEAIPVSAAQKLRRR